MCVSVATNKDSSATWEVGNVGEDPSKHLWELVILLVLEFGGKYRHIIRWFVSFSESGSSYCYNVIR